VKEPSDDDIVAYRFDFGNAALGRMVEELLPTHAFDKGNKPHIQLLREHSPHDHRRVGGQ
jgi:hypothetical protein